MKFAKWGVAAAMERSKRDRSRAPECDFNAANAEAPPALSGCCAHDGLLAMLRLNHAHAC